LPQDHIIGDRLPVKKATLRSYGYCVPYAVRFPIAAEAAGKRQRFAPTVTAFPTLSVFPLQLKLREKGNS